MEPEERGGSFLGTRLPPTGDAAPGGADPLRAPTHEGPVADLAQTGRWRRTYVTSCEVRSGAIQGVPLRGTRALAGLCGADTGNLTHGSAPNPRAPPPGVRRRPSQGRESTGSSVCGNCAGTGADSPQDGRVGRGQFQQLRADGPRAPMASAVHANVCRRDLLGGLLHEYYRAAA
jgi:hypothetical protein